MKKTWIVGTRGSKLALKQADIVVKSLEENYPEYQFVTKTIRTTGDAVRDKPLHMIGGKGLFVKEIEEELLSGTIDFAVHSMKDVPTELDRNLAIGAVLKREDPRDVFISLKHGKFLDVGNKGRVGTNSLRRKSQILQVNKGIDVVSIRGNVDTRIRKMGSEDLDGIVLAYAGVKRMGFERYVREILSLDIMVPPSGQGAIGVETRVEPQLLDMLKPLNHEISFQEVSIERNLQTTIGGGCSVPLGINATIEGGSLTLYIAFGREDGSLLMRDKQVGQVDRAEAMIAEAKKRLDDWCALS